MNTVFHLVAMVAFILLIYLTTRRSGQVTFLRRMLLLSRTGDKYRGDLTRATYELLTIMGVACQERAPTLLGSMDVPQLLDTILDRRPSSVRQRLSPSGELLLELGGVGQGQGSVKIGEHVLITWNSSGEVQG